MKTARPDLSELSLDELIDLLPWYDPGHHLCRWNLDAKEPKRVIYRCLDEMDNLACRAEVISWSTQMHGEAVGRDFYRGISLMANEINERARIIEWIIRKATAEIDGNELG